MRGGNVLVMLFLLSLLFSQSQECYSQSSAGSKTLYESRYIVDMPNAGVLTKGTYSFYSSAFTGGGLSLQFDAAPFTNFNIGLSFSGVNIIGSGDIEWQNIPGIHLKFRVWDESELVPAITLGVNTQGKGTYSFEEKRFVTLSPGVFLALSKNFEWALGTVAFHSGITYSVEPMPEDRNPNLYLGFEHSIGSYISLNGEFNFNIDDNTHLYLDKKGLLNLALRWSLAEGVTLEMQTRDLLENVIIYKGFNRAIYLEYINSF